MPDRASPIVENRRPRTDRERGDCGPGRECRGREHPLDLGHVLETQRHFLDIVLPTHGNGEPMVKVGLTNNRIRVSACTPEGDTVASAHLDGSGDLEFVSTTKGRALGGDVFLEEVRRLTVPLLRDLRVGTSFSVEPVRPRGPEAPETRVVVVRRLIGRDDRRFVAAVRLLALAKAVMVEATHSMMIRPGQT